MASVEAFWAQNRWVGQAGCAQPGSQDTCAPWAQPRWGPGHNLRALRTGLWSVVGLGVRGVPVGQSLWLEGTGGLSVGP